VIKTKNLSKKLFIVLPTALFLTAYLSVPEKITVTRGQNIDLNFGLSAKADTKNTGVFDSTIKFFNIIPIKTVSVSVTPEYYVIPSGEAIGIKLHTDGVLVLGTGDITAIDGNFFAPSKKAGLKKGDRIIAVNNEKVTDTFSLKRLINKFEGMVTLTIIREDNSLKIPITAPLSKDTGNYQIGAWVKDSAAGIGTMTFYFPENNCFAALGHGICDADTDTLLKAKDGTVNCCNVLKIQKSTDGTPGQIIGDFTNKELGNIYLNSDVGIYGKSNKIPKNNPVALASRFEMNTGKATLLCDIDANGVKAYQIEITKIYKSPKSPNKSFVFKVTDTSLIEKTGGIVQGMSGSPILQNGKLVGAVTHVFVNDSKRGYGIFAENMLDMVNTIEKSPVLK